MKIIINIKQMHFKEYLFKFGFIYNFIPVKLLLKYSKKNTIFPFYHFVDAGTNNIVNHLYQTKTKAQFIEDVMFFKRHFTSLSIEDLKFEKSTANKYGFFLSFDDGLSNFYNVVAPILLKEKVFAINFLNSNFIDNKGLFYRYKVNLLIDILQQNDFSKAKKEAINELFKLEVFNKQEVCNLLKKVSINETNIINKLSKILKFSFSDFLKTQKPYLSENQILELVDKGFSFGAHSKRHPRYSQISIEKQLNETLESVQQVKEKFNLKESYFSFPFSDDGVTEAFFNKIRNEKIVSFGSSGLKDDDMENHYQRIPMEYKSKYSAETVIKGELLYYLLKRLIKKNKIIRN
jgi:hypothetical protein